MGSQDDDSMYEDSYTAFTGAPFTYQDQLPVNAEARGLCNNLFEGGPAGGFDAENLANQRHRACRGMQM